MTEPEGEITPRNIIESIPLEIIIAAFRIEMVSRFRDLISNALGDITPEDATPKVLELCFQQSIYSDSVSDMVARSLAGLRNNQKNKSQVDETSDNTQELTDKQKLILDFRRRLIDKFGKIFREILKEADSTPATPNRPKILTFARAKLNAELMSDILNEIYTERQTEIARDYFNSPTSSIAAEGA